MERHAKRAVDNSSKRRQVTEKLHKAIEKSKRKGDRHVRDQKKGGFGRKSKADDIEDVEITSEEDNIEENNKPQADDFFIQEEEDSKSHIFYN